MSINRIMNLDEQIAETLLEWRRQGYRCHQSITGHCELHACKRCQLDRLLDERERRGR
jgi:hypothetical protein